MITHVTQKRDGIIKGRAVTNRKQQKSREYFGESRSTSSTIQLESLILSLLIGSFDNRDVAITDIADAYLFANMEENEIIDIKNDAVDIMCKVDKSYQKFLIYEKGNKVIYMKLNKALYSCVRSALLWYNTFKSKL